MKRRSGVAIAAQHRKAGPMHHKLKPRGGAKNDQPDLLEEAADDLREEIRCMIETVREKVRDHRHDQSLEERMNGVNSESEYERGAADAWEEILAELESL